MQAIILAAGMGKRLREYTADNTKCMVEVNGVRLIDRMLSQLNQHNLKRVVVVIGYEGKKLRNHIESHFPDMPITFVENNIYDKTNNIYSLWLARDLMAQDDTLLLESDLIFEDRVLSTAISSEEKNVALVSKYESWMDGTMVRINDSHDIVNFIPKADFNYADTASYFKTVNIYKFSKNFIEHQYLPFLDAYIKALGENEYYEQVLRVLTLVDKSGLKALPITGMDWYEIDDVQDLRIAETIFADPSLRLSKLQKSYGGYWRYPKLLDFCYLVNPYFPPARMIDEIKANFDILMREYPSGMGVNSLLAARYFGIRQEYVAVGNGAAELIKSVMEHHEGNLGVIYPTFEEYPNRHDYSRLVIFHPDNEDFIYSASDLIHFYNDKDISSLLIVNPDNPSGNFIPFDDLINLCEWASEKSVRLIIDESFVDFSQDAIHNTLLRDEILERYPHLCVVKSISKSYGVPGFRLGIIASSNIGLIERIRKNVAIWNINSFAEFYMQIFCKYEKDYFKACEEFRNERDIFKTELDAIDYLRVIPSEANYFLIEVKGVSSYQLTLRLLSDFNILIKDCSSKKGFSENGRQYVRVAVRDRRDNSFLINALKSIKQ